MRASLTGWPHSTSYNSSLWNGACCWNVLSIRAETGPPHVLMLVWRSWSAQHRSWPRISPYSEHSYKMSIAQKLWLTGQQFTYCTVTIGRKPICNKTLQNHHEMLWFANDKIIPSSVFSLMNCCRFRISRRLRFWNVDFQCIQGIILVWLRPVCFA